MTRNLLGFLTQDITDNPDAQAKSDYLEIIDFAIGTEIKNIQSKRAASSRKDLSKFRKVHKFRDFIASLYKIKGEGYKELSISPIIIGSNTKKNLERLSVLDGSVKLGGDKKDIIQEYTAILDQLKADGKINKDLYKRLYYKRFL